MISPFVTLDSFHAPSDGVVIADVRWYLDGRSGHDAYAAGHIPGAVFVDLDRWLAAPGSPAAGRHPLPDPEVFAEGMRQLGIADDDFVLAYDDAGGVIAARLVWMLRVTGHDAALIDGGLGACDVPLETGVVDRPAAEFTARPWPSEALADIDAAADAGGGVVVVDARDRERFEGGNDPVDPRPGHIPGARNLPCRGHLDADGRLLPKAQLQARFHAVGATPGTDVISYCGSGVTACHNLLVLEHLGHGPGRLYPGSYSQYSHTERPVATGP
ncbi:MAG: putative thiosulfate sulfurtransferase [Conexibacter sp.]|nr:putative thiosulfate sulfurtransferase [Conexibacter sp.]